MKRALQLIVCVAVAVSAFAPHRTAAAGFDVVAAATEARQWLFGGWDRYTVAQREAATNAVYEVAPQAVKIASIKKKIAFEVERRGLDDRQILFELAYVLENEVNLLARIIDRIDPKWGTAHLTQVIAARNAQQFRASKVDALLKMLESYSQLPLSGRGNGDLALEWAKRLREEAKDLENFAIQYSQSTTPPR